MIPPAHHESAHRNVLVAVLILLALIVLGAIAYQVIVMRRALPGGDRALRAQYQQEQWNQVAAFVQSMGAPKPISDAEKKAIAEFIKQNPPQPMTEAEQQEIARQQAELSESGYQQWKSSRNQ